MKINSNHRLSNPQLRAHSNLDPLSGFKKELSKIGALDRMSKLVLDLVPFAIDWNKNDIYEKLSICHNRLSAIPNPTEDQKTLLMRIETVMSHQPDQLVTAG